MSAGDGRLRPRSAGLQRRDAGFEGPLILRAAGSGAASSASAPHPTQEPLLTFPTSGAPPKLGVGVSGWVRGCKLGLKHTDTLPAWKGYFIL